MNSKPRAATGISEVTDAFTGGAEAAKRALDHLGADLEAHLALVFCTSRLDPAAVTQGIRSVLKPDVPLFGANANGVIGNDFVGYDGFQVGVALLHLPGVEMKFFHHTGIAFKEAEAGDVLGTLISPQLRDTVADDFLLFFYDSVNRLKGRFIMNLATPLLEGMARHLPSGLRVAGARVMGDMKFNPTTQWCGQALLQDSAVALLFSGGLRVHKKVLHGCRPTSAYHRVTKADGPVVLEIDGRPALDLIGDILGPELRGDFQQYKFFLTFGVNHGGKWGDFVEDHYASRMCVNVDQKRGGIVLAEPLAEGDEFQIMRRNFDMRQYRAATAALVDEVVSSGSVPFFALYINCAGRAASYYGSQEEEAAYVAEGLGKRVPLLGVYEAGEFSRVNGRLQLLDWSGVLVLFSYPA
ncbi:MAG: FIST C-terminal domain-containing protein [Verrucomicrobiaceae bacterium]|nr:FIST C-terminal domain-containing protein [Verrucomicrobiaceae bacterium]